MRSGWFFGSAHWQEYLAEYAKTRPECLHEWKSSPLTSDHDFTWNVNDGHFTWETEEHLSQVIDLRTHKWSDIRKSYHSIIHRANEQYDFYEMGDMFTYMAVHRKVFGNVRTDETFFEQQKWIHSGNAMILAAFDAKGVWKAATLWIIYNSNAYYASAPSLERNIQHAMIWNSFQLLRQHHEVSLVDMGQIDGETEKERNIGKFKAGFGGEAKPFTIVRRAT